MQCCDWVRVVGALSKAPTAPSDCRPLAEPLRNQPFILRQPFVYIDYLCTLPIARKQLLQQRQRFINVNYSPTSTIDIHQPLIYINHCNSISRSSTAHMADQHIADGVQKLLLSSHCDGEEGRGTRRRH